MKTFKEKKDKLLELGFDYIVRRKNKTLKERISLLIDEILIYIKWRSGLGAFNEKPKDTDIQAKAFVKGVKLPKEWVNPDYKKLRVFDQHTGSCTTQAHTSQLELAFGKKFDRRFSMVMAKYFDGNKVEGSYGSTLASVHKNIGALPLKKGVDDSDHGMAWKEYISKTYTSDELKEASKYKIKGYIYVDTTNQNEMKKAIKKYGSVSITVKASDIWPNVGGYHRMLLVGWDNKGFLGAKNSWGKSKLVQVPFGIRMYPAIAYIVKKEKELEEAWPWKNFSRKECKGLDKKACDRLQKIRDCVRRPLIVKFDPQRRKAYFYYR